MKLDILPIGLYGENIYVLHEKDHVLIVDPGAHAKEIAKTISDKETADAIILTHGHEDHTGAADDLVDMYHCPVYLHESDFVLVDPHDTKNVGGYVTPVYAPLHKLEPEVDAGIFHIVVYHTPGHTEGSCCIRYRNILFSGDTLFAGSCGRTDLYSGDEEKMLASLQFLATLPRDLRVFPGHGPSTTIGQECDTNFYMIRL